MKECRQHKSFSEYHYAKTYVLTITTAVKEQDVTFLHLRKPFVIFCSFILGISYLKCFLFSKYTYFERNLRIRFLGWLICIRHNNSFLSNNSFMICFLLSFYMVDAFLNDFIKAYECRIEILLYANNINWKFDGQTYKGLFKAIPLNSNCALM